MICPKCHTSGGNMKRCTACNVVFCSNCKHKELPSLSGNICPNCGSHDKLVNAESYEREQRFKNMENNSSRSNSQNSTTVSNISSSQVSSSDSSSGSSSPSKNFQSSSNTSSVAGGVLFGAAIGASAALVGFGLKGIWKIIIFPFWIIFWMFKLVFNLFKYLFYIFPKFLLSKGIIGKIGCGIYLFAWGIGLFVYFMGKDYILRNGVYFIIILIGIISSASVAITFKLKDKKNIKRFAITIISGIFIIAIVAIIGLFVTKDLVPTEIEKQFIGNRFYIENIQK